jgi:hypothetical protein
MTAIRAKTNVLRKQWISLPAQVGGIRQLEQLRIWKQQRKWEPQSGQNKPNPAFGKTCHYCKKKNHFQSDCCKPKRDNALMVQVKEVIEEHCKSVFTSKN